MKGAGSKVSLNHNQIGFIKRSGDRYPGKRSQETPLSS
jgi:hypothetical protein